MAYSDIIGSRPVIRHRFHKYLLAAALQFTFFFTSAQQPYSLVHYDEDVLPQTSVGNIEQDENGYLWMNTQYGIVRFGGETFRVFTTGNLKGLTSNRIPVCAKGLDHAVYFVDENKVILKVKSPAQFEIKSKADCIKAYSLPLFYYNDFAYMEFDKKGGYKRLADSMNFDLNSDFLKAYATGEKEGYLFYVDLQGKVRLCYYNGKNYQSVIQADSFKAQHTFKLNNFIFIQTGSDRAQLFEQAGGKQDIPVTGLPAQFSKTFKEENPVLFSNSSGTFFYSSGKLYQYELNNGAIAATLVFENLPCTNVANVMRERSSGDFLISTQNTGFYRIKKKRFSVIDLTRTSSATFEPNTGFPNNIVYAVCLWDQEHIFCNGYITPVTGAGISRNFDPRNKTRLDYFFQHPKDDQHIWLNLWEGIHSFNKKTGSYTPLLKISYPKKVIELSDGTTIIVAIGNIAWLQHNRFTELYRNDTLSITTAEKVTEDCLAIGTAKNGLWYFYPRERRLRRIPYKEALKVRFIFKDRSGRIWFTTYGQGLFYLSGNSIIPLPLDNAGYLAIGHCIIEDNSGHFWVSTNHGLFRLDYASLLSIIQGKSSKLFYTYYDKTDGFNTNEFNGGCYPSGVYQKETGLMFFPSMDGIVRFNPDSISDITSNTPVFLDEIVLNDTGHLYTVTDKTVFPRQTSSIRIDFSSPYYGHGENIKFSYALSNAPEQWKDLKRSRSIVLSNLPGGSYTLIIRKEGATGPPVLASFQFEIEKKFSETVLFKLLLLALVVAAVYLYFRARLFYLHKERKRLEHIVAVKTIDQLKLIDQLKESIASLTQLQQELGQMIGHKENIIAVLIHDIKSPLYFLNTVAEHLYKRIEHNPPEKNKEISGEIAASLNRLYLFTQDFATWLDASQPGRIQKREEADLEKITGEALAVYREIIDKKNICIRQQITAKRVWGDEPMIKSVVRNLIDNAVKHTAGGAITIITSPDSPGETCTLLIADEGKGMTGEQVAALNHYFQYSEDISDFSTSGFGHKVIKDFLQKSGGSIHYRQNRPSGIIVTVHLPVLRPLEID